MFLFFLILLLCLQENQPTGKSAWKKISNDISHGVYVCLHCKDEEAAAVVSSLPPFSACMKKKEIKSNFVVIFSNVNISFTSLLTTKSKGTNSSVVMEDLENSTQDFILVSFHQCNAVFTSKKLNS